MCFTVNSGHVIIHAPCSGTLIFIAGWTCDCQNNIRACQQSGSMIKWLNNCQWPWRKCERVILGEILSLQKAEWLLLCSLWFFTVCFWLECFTNTLHLGGLVDGGDGQENTLCTAEEISGTLQYCGYWITCSWLENSCIS